MNHRRSKHSQIMWTKIYRVGPKPVDLESTDYFTLYYYYYSWNLSPSQYNDHVRNPNIYLSHPRCYTNTLLATTASPQSLPEIVTGDSIERNQNGRMTNFDWIDWKSGISLSEKQAWTRYKRQWTRNAVNFLFVLPTRWSPLTSGRAQKFTSSSLCENSATSSNVLFLQIYPWTPWNGRNSKRKCRDSLWGRRNFISASFEGGEATSRSLSHWTMKCLQ